MDIGDIVGVRALVFNTKTSEISIHATEVTLLSRVFRCFLRSSMA